jgi:hypothetical protein
MRQGIATVGLVFFALVGGAANYLWVNGSTTSRAAEANEAAEIQAKERKNEG